MEPDEADRLVMGEDFTKRVEEGCLSIEARLLPGEYLDIRAPFLPESNQKSKPESRTKYSFQIKLRIEPIPGCGAEGDAVEDLIYSRGSQVPAVMESVMEGIKNRAWILSKGKRLRPVLSLMEDSHGIDPGRTILLMFEAHGTDLNREYKVSLILERLLPELGLVRFEWTPAVWKKFNS